MFNVKTTFVLGAGASAEFGFPLGTQLRDQIRESLSFEGADGYEGPAVPLIKAAKREGPHSTDAYANAATSIVEGITYSNSIDDFLHQRRNDEPLLQLGKMAVARLVLQKEQESPLWKLEENECSLVDAKMNDTWLFKLVRMMVKDLTPETADQAFSNLSFITFNYDRSLELFLSYALTEAFSIRPEASREIVANAPITHVYGSLGALPGFRGEQLPFGKDWERSNIARVAGRIQTYTESVADRLDMQAIHDAMAQAKQVVFLGCGFHTQNIELLTPPSGMPATNIIGTTVGISPTGLEAVTRRIAKMFSSNVRVNKMGDGRIQEHLRGLTCSKTMDEWALALAG